MRRGGRPELAVDLLAEVFAAAYVAAPRFRPSPQPAQAWLLGISRHKLLRSMRRARVKASARRRLEVDAIELCPASVAALEELKAEDPMRLLVELPPDQREAVQARVLEDLDYRELATRLRLCAAARTPCEAGVARGGAPAKVPLASGA